MKKIMVVLVIVLCTQFGYSAVINTGTDSTFVYQKDVSSNHDGSSIIDDAEINDGLAVYNNINGIRSWVSNNDLATQCGMVLHFQAPAGYVITDATVFSTTWIRDDLWEDVYVKGQWGTTQRENIWDYQAEDIQFYYRQQQNIAKYWDENTTNLSVNASDLFLTFSTYQSSYEAPMMYQKGWFATNDDPSTGYSPGLVVTLSVVPVPEPATLGLLGMGLLGLISRKKK